MDMLQAVAPVIFGLLALVTLIFGAATYTKKMYVRSSLLLLLSSGFACEALYFITANVVASAPVGV